LSNSGHPALAILGSIQTSEYLGSILQYDGEINERSFIILLYDQLYNERMNVGLKREKKKMGI
ncbi:hypothetical protein CR513_16889, partial [Mucuna pruriens]